MKILSFLPGEEIPGLESNLLRTQSADEHLCREDGQARCSLWWTVVPEASGERLGIIGHFQADTAESGRELLVYAAKQLELCGCTLAIGPMDGNTWRRYRVLTARGAEPSFYMEPDNPPSWPAAFEAAGFSALARYSSSLVRDLFHQDPRAARAEERLSRTGVQIRGLSPANFEEDLRRIYDVSVVSFVRNFLYSPLPEAEFLAQYLPYEDQIRPELVLIAECDGAPAGYLFAIPDFAEMQRGESVRTVIGKTLAVLPGKRFGGLGVVLTNLLHQRAQSLGYTRVIHALQHEENDRVRNMSREFGVIMRQYTLYSRRLG